MTKQEIREYLVRLKLEEMGVPIDSPDVVLEEALGGTVQPNFNIKAAKKMRLSCKAEA